MKIVALFALALCACPPSPAPPQPDSGDASALGDANAFQNVCANLALIPCAEGTDPKCTEVIAHVVDAGLTKVDVACLGHAQTKEAARACGFVSCP